MTKRMALSLLMLACCGCEQAAKIQVAPETGLLTSVGDTLKLRATVLDSQGKPLPTAPVAFKAMTPTMATVTPDGLVSAVSSGTATVLITSGKVSKNIEVVVQIPKKIKIAPSSESMFSGDFLLMVGVSKGFKATVVTDRDTPMIAGDVTWSSSDPAIFTVDKEGTVKTVAEGEATLTARAAGIEGQVKITVKHEELTEDGLLVQ